MLARASYMTVNDVDDPFGSNLILGETPAFESVVSEAIPLSEPQYAVDPLLPYAITAFEFSLGGLDMRSPEPQYSTLAAIYSLFAE